MPNFLKKFLPIQHIGIGIGSERMPIFYNAYLAITVLITSVFQRTIISVFLVREFSGQGFSLKKS